MRSGSGASLRLCRVDQLEVLVGHELEDEAEGGVALPGVLFAPVLDQVVALFVLGLGQVGGGAGGEVEQAEGQGLAR